MTVPDPTPDLRTLAVEAIRQVRAPHGPLGDGSLRSGSAEELADAVLAAVLRPHREMVLGEAADALDADQHGVRRHPSAHHPGCVRPPYRRDHPPPGLGATLPAESAEDETP